MENVELKRKVTLKRKGGEEETAPKKSKLWLWLLLLAVLAVVIVLFLKNSSSNGDESTGIEQTVEQPAVTSTKEVQGTEAEVTTVETDETQTSEETATSATVEEPITPQVETTPATTTPVAEPAPQPVVSNTPTVTLSQGNIEEKAKQVIRGNFGNGADRKQQLGNEYDAIQQRVNEMYRASAVN